MNSKLSILLVLMLLAGCKMTERAAIRKLEKIQDRHPALFSRDTVTVDSSRIDSVVILQKVFVPGSKIDTAVVTSLSDIIESLTVENKKLRIELKTTANVETNTRTWELSGEVKSDTIRELIRVPVRQVIYRRVPAAACTVTKTGWPGWSLIAAGVVSALLAFFLGDKKKKD